MYMPTQYCEDGQVKRIRKQAGSEQKGIQSIVTTRGRNLLGDLGIDGRIYQIDLEEIKWEVLDQRPPLWSSGQSSWLQIRRPGFVSRHYQKKK
jgi:hypothetical protein